MFSVNFVKDEIERLKQRIKEYEEVGKEYGMTDFAKTQLNSFQNDLERSEALLNLLNKIEPEPIYCVVVESPYSACCESGPLDKEYFYFKKKELAEEFFNIKKSEMREKFQSVHNLYVHLEEVEVYG